MGISGSKRRRAASRAYDSSNINSSGVNGSIGSTGGNSNSNSLGVIAGSSASIAIAGGGGVGDLLDSHKKPLSGTSPQSSRSNKGRPSYDKDSSCSPSKSSKSSSSSKKSSSASAVALTKANDPGAFSRKKLEELYSQFMDPEQPQRIGPNGVCALLEELSVKPEDPAVLAMCWRIGASEACYFTRDEFINGLEKLRIDSIEKLRARFPSFRQDLTDEACFRQIYEYAFTFSKEAAQRSLSIEMASAMMNLLLAPTYPLVTLFLEYIESQPQIKALNLDQWCSMLDLCKTSTEDLANYDFAGSWPVIYDEFVMWLKQKDPEKYGSMPSDNTEDPYTTSYSHYRYNDDGDD